MLKYKIKKHENNEVILEVEIEKSEVKTELDKTCNDLSYKVKIPGFRKGKIPRNILEMHLTKEYLYEKTADELIEKTYYDAIKQSKIEPIDRPNVKVIQIEEKKPLIYEITVKVKPEVKIGSFDKIEVKKDIVKILKKDVDSEILRMQESQAKLIITKDRKAKEGDFLIIDSESFVDGVPLKDGKMNKQLIELGENNSPEINKKLVGCSIGDEKNIVIKVPENSKDKELAGKAITYKIKILEIKEKELPEINDDFAKNFGNYKDLNEFKKSIKENLKNRAENISKNNYESELINKVEEVCEVKVPEVLVDREVNYMIKTLEEDLKTKNISLEDYLKSIKADESKLKKEYKSVAEKRVKKELILDKIAKDQKIEVTDEELKKKIEEIAKDLKQDPIKVEATFKKNNNLNGLKETIRREKIFEYISKQIKKSSSEKEV
ncbi:MAG: trigger factor [Candidatus Caldatribacteriota bacterium]|nr:trigger factor [Candidatus Caldatribacteriota bacterium]